MNYIKKIVYEPVTIFDKFIPIKINTRPGTIMDDIKGGCLHNSGCPGVDWYQLYLSITRDDLEDWVSYNAVMAFNADIYHFVPIEETTYTSGSNDYTDYGKRKYNSLAWKHTFDLEVCTKIRNDMTRLQVENLAKWGAVWIYKFRKSGLTVKEDLDRHLDIAKDRPICPEYLKHKYEWKRYLIMAERFYDIIAEEAEKNVQSTVIRHYNENGYLYESWKD